jgi:hypothetical protein
MNRVFWTVLLIIPAAIAADAVGNNAAGHWEGAIQTPGADLAIVVDIAKSGDGKLGGAIAMPSEKLQGLPLKSVTVDGTSIRFHARLDQEFNGYFAGDGDEIKGDITVEGHQLPIYLKRTGDAKIEPRASSAAIAKTFEGSWTAILGSENLRLILTNLPDGTSTGSVVNMNEGELEIPVSAIAVDGAGLKLGLKAVDGSYSGQLSADGTELVGTFQQGSQSVPLKFRRAAK